MKKTLLLFSIAVQSMKKTLLLFSIAVLVVVVLLAGFINYITDTPVTEKSTQKTQIKTNTSAETINTPAVSVKKKPCACCDERMARLREQIQKARERKKRENNTAVKGSTSTGNGK